MSISNLRNRVDTLYQESLIEEGLLRSAEQSLLTLEASVKALTKEIFILGQVDVALNELSTRVLGQSTSSIDKMITSGLKFVFDDVNLDFKTVVDKYRGKTSVKFILTQDGKEAPIMDSYGGGVITVAGVLLRVVTIMSLKSRRFLLLDETLGMLSKQYVPNVSKLLRKLSSELNFDILMVTHTEEFAEYAQAHFKAKSTPAGGTVFEKVSDQKAGPALLS